MAYLFDRFIGLMEAPRARATIIFRPRDHRGVDEPSRQEKCPTYRHQSILIIGAGPIVIGQACEFDYSGAQACKALREEGYKVILVNSNPATIMTDPDTADVTYVEPITWQIVEKDHRQGAPPAILLPTMGGQTALNCALDLAPWRARQIQCRADRRQPPRRSTKPKTASSSRRR